jgi:hypothetical protein
MRTAQEKRACSPERRTGSIFGTGRDTQLKGEAILVLLLLLPADLQKRKATEGPATLKVQHGKLRPYTMDNA